MNITDHSRMHIHIYANINAYLVLSFLGTPFFRTLSNDPFYQKLENFLPPKDVLLNSYYLNVMSGKGKNNQATAPAPKSKKNARKATRNAQKEEKLINITSEENSSASDVENEATTSKNRQVAQRGPQNKRSRTEKETAMDEDFASSSPSSPTSSTTSNNSFTPNANTAAQAQSGSVSPKSADLSNPDQENQPRSPTSEIGNNCSSMNKDTAETQQRNAAKHDISPESSTNTSRHAQDSTMGEIDDDLDTNDITKLKAAVPYTDVKKTNETKRQFISRLENYLLDRFDSLAKVLVIKHKDTRLAVAVLHNSEQHKELINSVLDELKIDETSDAPIFHNFDPQKLHELEQLRALHVRNIPCRITKKNLKTYFKKFGIIETIRIRVPHNSIFQSAEIIYDDATSINSFYRSKWGVFIMGEAVRIYPANLTKEEHKARHQHTAVLRNIPRNAQNTDYMRMFSNFNASAMGIPRFINNSIKPWIYINFQSEEVMQTAIEIAPSLNNRQLIWDSPDNVRNFCPRCSNLEHKAKDCDDIRSRGRKPTSKVLIDVYKKHGIVNAATKQADKQLQQQQQKNSKARSRSRSRPRPPSNVEFSVPSNSIDTPPNSYADALNKGTSGLNNSHHESGNRNNKQQTPPINNNTPPLRNISKDSL